MFTDQTDLYMRMHGFSFSSNKSIIKEVKKIGVKGLSIKDYLFELGLHLVVTYC